MKEKVVGVTRHNSDKTGDTGDRFSMWFRDMHHGLDARMCAALQCAWNVAGLYIYTYIYYIYIYPSGLN